MSLRATSPRRDRREESRVGLIGVTGVVDFVTVINLIGEKKEDEIAFVDIADSGRVAGERERVEEKEYSQPSSGLAFIAGSSMSLSSQLVRSMSRSSAALAVEASRPDEAAHGKGRPRQRAEARRSRCTGTAIERSYWPRVP
jgi:hypothetical protein